MSDDTTTMDAENRQQESQRRAVQVRPNPLDLRQIRRLLPVLPHCSEDEQRLVCDGGREVVPVALEEDYVIRDGVLYLRQTSDGGLPYLRRLGTVEREGGA